MDLTNKGKDKTTAESDLVAESGRRLTRSKLSAKRPHSGGHWPGKKLNNVGEDLGKTSGRPPEDLRKTSYFFFCILEKTRKKLVTI